MRDDDEINFHYHADSVFLLGLTPGSQLKAVYFLGFMRRLCLPVSFTINLSPLNIDSSHSW